MVNRTHTEEWCCFYRNQSPQDVRKFKWVQTLFKLTKLTQNYLIQIICDCSHRSSERTYNEYVQFKSIVLELSDSACFYVLLNDYDKWGLFAWNMRLSERSIKPIMNSRVIILCLDRRFFYWMIREQGPTDVNCKNRSRPLLDQELWDWPSFQMS